MSIRPIYFESKDIGAHIKKYFFPLNARSKRHYVWKFELDTRMITVELMNSHFSGKKKVLKDGVTMIETQKFGGSFQYPFNLGNHMLNIVQHGELFELRIDNQSFSHLYN